MPISFSSNGSTAGSPTKGLLGNAGPKGLAGLISPSKPKPAPQASTGITPFVPNTGSKIYGEPNINAADHGNGTPTASGNSSLSGEGYFKGLLNSANPSERQAGQTWLSHQANPGLLPKHPVSSITTSPDGTTKHTFDTKGTTGASESGSSNSSTTGTSTTSSTTGSTGTNPGLLPKPTGPKVGTPTQNAQNVLDTSNLNGDPQYQALAQQNRLLTQAQNNVSTAGTAGSENTINQEGTDMLGNDYSNLFRPQSTGNLAGEKGILNPKLVNAQAGNTAEANRLLSGAQLATGGAENVLGASLLSPTSYGQTNTSGLTGVQDSGQYGTGPGAAGRVDALKGLGSEYTQGQSRLKAADGIQDQIVSTLQSNPQLNNDPVTLLNNLNEYLGANFSGTPQQLLAQQVKSYIDTLGIDSGSLTNLAHQQKGTMTQLLESLRKTAETQNEAKNPEKLNTSKSSGGSVTGTTITTPTGLKINTGF